MNLVAVSRRLHWLSREKEWDYKSFCAHSFRNEFHALCVVYMTNVEILPVIGSKSVHNYQTAKRMRAAVPKTI